LSEQTAVKHGVWAPVPPRVRLLILATVMNGFAFGYFLIYVTAFLPEIGFTAAVVGTIFAIEGIALVLAGIPLAVLSDRFGRKWFVVLGSFIFAPTVLVFGLTRDVNVMYTASALGGLGEAALLASWNAMIADLTDLGNRDAAFSLSFIVSTASYSLGSALPLAFGPIESATGLSPLAVHSWAFIVFGVASFSSPAALWLLLRNYAEKPPERKTEAAKPAGMGQALKFSVFNSIIGLGAGLIIPLMATWLWLKFAVPDAYSGPFLALSGLTIAFSAVASPRLSKKMGLFPAIVATAGSSTAFMLSLAFVSNVFAAGGLYLVRAALMNMNSPLMDSFLMGITSPNRRGLVSTINAVVWRIPNNVSTIIGGYILTYSVFDVPSLGVSHLDLPWILATALYLLGIGLLYANFRNVRPTL
jgi:MFS family permease